MPITSPYKLKNFYRQNQPNKFTLLGHVAAVGMSVASVVKEGMHYAQLAVDVMTDGKDSHLSLHEEIQQKDAMQRALAKFRRTHISNPAPPLGEQSPMRELPTAKLANPLMMVPGWDMAHDRFLTLTEKLTEGGANGGKAVYIRDGKFYHDRDCKEALPEAEVSADAKVFVTVFEELGESPETSSPQLAKNIQALERVTGAERPDLFAYSQGGLATRKYLDDSGDEVGEFMMLGTPNLGAGLADVSRFLYDAQDRGYAVDFLMREKHLDEDDEKAMRFMASSGEKLRDLNSRWDKQMSQTEGFLVVGADDDKTLHWGWPPRKLGDSMVEKEKLAPAGVEVKILEEGPWTNHRDLPYSAQVYEHMLEHYDWN